jgi:hypothetical protein
MSIGGWREGVARYSSTEYSVEEKIYNKIWLDIERKIKDEVIGWLSDCYCIDCSGFSTVLAFQKSSIINRENDA